MCNSCNVLYINRVKCHESGCPDAWLDEIRECLWCGNEFTPEYKRQEHCEQSCYSAYNGYPELDDLDLLPDNEDLP